MDIILTQWAVDSYLEIVLRKKEIAKDDFWNLIRPDVLRLKNYPLDTKFENSKFWSETKDHAGKLIPNGYKMKWHNIGNGKIQLRLPIGILEASYVCAAYIKSNPSKEKRELAKFKTYLQLIKQNQFIECGRI